MREPGKKSKVRTLKTRSVAPDEAKQVNGGSSGQPWRGSSIGRALEKVGE